MTCSPDGKTLIYADSLGQGLGFIDISDPRNPKPLGHLPLGGEPTSLAMKGELILVAINHGEFRGELRVIELGSRKTLAELPLKGQPDCLAISPDQRFGVLAIENESTEGFPEQPPGFVEIFTLSGKPETWGRGRVDLTSLKMYQAEDPEPEYVAINQDNLAAVTLQENNHIVLIDLEKASVVSDFSAGSQALTGVDLQNDKHIALNESSEPIPREPDSVAWCSAGIIIANEGDLRGGTRSFSIFDTQGLLVFDSASQTEEIAVKLGRYPDHRSNARGTEPEAVSVATFGNTEYIFVGLERANLVLVYSLKQGQKEPQFEQALSTGPGPESILPIPQQNLLAIGSEADYPEENLRSHIGIFRRGDGPPEFPTLISDGVPWGALSGLTADPNKQDIFYTVGDKALRPNRILKIDASRQPALITLESEVRSSEDLSTKYDLEGISLASSGGFWLVAEGKKKRPDLLLRVTKDGRVSQEIEVLKPEKLASQKYGIEGVAEVNGKVVVAFQSGTDGSTTMTAYSPTDQTWQSTSYPLDHGHFVSGLAAGPEGRLAVLERDKFSHSEALHKKIFTVDPAHFGSPNLEKQLEVDLVPEYSKLHMAVPAKVEGLAFRDGHYWVINDNDAMKSSYGETNLLKVESRPSAK